MPRLSTYEKRVLKPIIYVEEKPIALPSTKSQRSWESLRAPLVALVDGKAAGGKVLEETGRGGEGLDLNPKP